MDKAKTSGADLSLQPPSITKSHQEGVTKTLNAFDRSQLKSDRFNIWNTIGVQFSVGAAPLSTGVYLSLVVTTGGRPYFFWSSLVAIIGQFLVMLSLAEIASAYPHTAGKLRVLRQSSRRPSIRRFVTNTFLCRPALLGLGSLAAQECTIP